MLEVEHLLVEHIGVIGAPSYHQDEAQGNEGKSDEDDDEVLLAEGECLLFVSDFGGLCFLC